MRISACPTVNAPEFKNRSQLWQGFLTTDMRRESCLISENSTARPDVLSCHPPRSVS
jgi:hypothetical protein